MNKMPLRLLPALLLVAFSGTAAAAGFQLWEQNASGLGTSYAGSAAVADNASTIFFNPAGMTQLKGVQVSVGVNAVDASFSFRNQGSYGTGPFVSGQMPAGGGNGGDAGGWSAVPNAYLSWQLSPQWSVGLGLSSPFGLSTKYDDTNWIGRFHSLKSEIKTANVNPSVAYKVNDKVSLGFGLDYQRITAEMTSLVPTSPTTTALYRVKGDADTWGWNAGALFTLSESMRVGMSYRSGFTHKLEGDRSVGANTISAKADLKLPDTFVMSVWQQISDRWEAMGDLSYTRWSVLNKLNVNYAGGTDIEDFNYRNSWRFAYGAAYKASEAWKVKFGIAYDRTPTTDGDRSARVPDNNRIWLSLGAQWKPSKDAALDIGYAYLYLRDPQINQAKSFGTNGAAGTAYLQGKYQDSGHVLGVQYSQGF